MNLLQQLPGANETNLIQQEILSLLQLREDELTEAHLTRLRLLTEAIEETTFGAS